MSDLAKVIYDKFLMRDLLGKVGPGFVATLAVVKALKVDVTVFFTGTEAFWLLWLATLPALYMVGLALQISAEFIGLHSASPRPNYVLLFPAKGNWAQANIDLDYRLAKIRNAPPGKWGDGAKKQRERYVYLKEGSGNFAMALFVGIICLFFSDFKERVPQIVILAILSFTLFVSHFLHAERQAKFEITTLEESGLITAEKAKEMRGVLCLHQPTGYRSG